MESPFYEMTHNIPEEAATEANAWIRGYAEGQLEGRASLTRELCGYSDTKLLQWISQQRQVKEHLEHLVTIVHNTFGFNTTNERKDENGR